MTTLTADQIDRAMSLRNDQHLSYEKIAKQLAVSNSSIWKLFHPKQPKPPPPKTSGPPATRNISKPPPTLYHSSSVPITRPLFNIDRQKIQLTHEQMQDDLRWAVINTSRLRA